MNFFQDGGGRHLGFVRIVNSSVRSAVPENPTLEPNMKWIGSPVAEIWPFAYVGGNWYSKILAVVKWDNCYSSFCSFFSGVRQGGVLSPVLFNVYINSLVKVLVESDLGCHYTLNM